MCVERKKPRTLSVVDDPYLQTEFERNRLADLRARHNNRNNQLLHGRFGLALRHDRRFVGFDFDRWLCRGGLLRVRTPRSTPRPASETSSSTSRPTSGDDS